MLTAAQRKEYLEPDRPEDPRPTRVSVIQRTPKPPALEPEQDAPIDYHVPKRDPDKEELVRTKLIAAIKRGGGILLAGRRVGGHHIVMAAAGHGRGSSGGGNAGGGSSGGGGGGNSGGSGGGGFTLSGGGGGGGGGGSVGGAGGGGPGKPNYGPNSPPTASLPPFYESLKGYSQQYAQYGQNMDQLPMDCEPNDFPASSNSLQPDPPPKQYSLLQNVCATYGITVKDEDDLSSYVKDQSFLSYDDALMVDSVTGAVVDPLQFTATLTFSSPAEHALLETLTDAADLFLKEVIISLYLIIFK